MGLTKIRSFLKEQGYDGILLRKRHNFSWVTGGQSNYIVQATDMGVADLLITLDAVFIITSKMEERRIVEEELKDVEFSYTVVSDEWYSDLDQRIIEYCKGKTIAADTEFYGWANVESDLMKLRSTLSESEIDRYRWVCQEAARAVEETCRELLPGQTEYEIAGMLSKKVIEKGIHVNVALVATDERIRQYRHPIPTSKKLEKHAMVVLCAEYGGLVANVTRLVHFGPMTKDLEENAAKVARIDSAMLDKTRIGNTIGEIVKTGIRQYEMEGYPDDWKLLHQGGLTGYASREFLAAPTTEMRVESNQAYAWNPALPGVKSEDTILVKKDGIETMTYTGEWVYQSVRKGKEHYLRPTILVR